MASPGNPTGGQMLAANVADDDKIPIVDTSVGASNAANKYLTVADARTALAGSITSTTPTLVQSAKGTSRTTATQSITLGAAPTVGNLLVLLANGWRDADVTAAMPNWSKIMSARDSTGNSFVGMWVRQAQSGDPAAWTPAFSSTPVNAAILELNGVYSFEYSYNNVFSTNTISAPPIFRGMENKLVFYHYQIDQGTWVLSSLSSGCSLVQAHYGMDASNHQGALVKRDNPVTYADTALMVQDSMTWTGSAAGPITLAVAFKGQMSLA